MRGQSTEKADVFLLPLGREIAPDAPACVHHAGAGGLCQCPKLHHATARNSGLPRGIVQIQTLRRRGFIDRIHLGPVQHRQPARLVLIDNRVPARQPRRCDLIVQRDRGIGQVIKQRLKMIVEKRQPVFRALMLAPCADRLVQRIVGARRAKLQPVVLAKPRHRRLVQYHFGDRGQFDQVQLFGGALRRRIKPARAVQHIAEQVQPHRPQIAGRVNVDDTAAHGVIAGFRHRGRLHEPHAHQKPAQRRIVNPVTDPRGKSSLAQDRPRGQLLRGGVQRGQQHERLGHPMRKCRQRRHPLRRNIGIGRHPVIGQTIPSGELDHRHIWGKKPQRIAHGNQPLVIARHMAHGHAARQFRQNAGGVEPFGRAGYGDMCRISHLRASCGAVHPTVNRPVPRCLGSGTCPTWL